MRPLPFAFAAFAAVFPAVLLAACASGPGERARRPAQPPRAPVGASAELADEPSSAAPEGAPPTTAPCLAVGPDPAGVRATLEGRLAADEPGGRLLLLRLARPRCVLGLERTSYVRDVAVASTGTDLRPLVGHDVRVAGAIIAGSTDLGRPAMVLLVREIERLVPAHARDLTVP